MPGEAEGPHKGPFTIVVNGKKKEWDKHEITFEEVVNIAFDNNPPHGPNVVITVLYSDAAPPSKPSGSLKKGQSVHVKNGTSFDVTATDRS